MVEIIKNLYVGNQESIPGADFYLVNAAKNPWHVDAVGYKGKLDSNHPNYLIHMTEKVLSLNMIDPPMELMAKFTDPIVKTTLAFVKQNIQRGNVLIRCNQGLSRSPSLALIYLAKSGQIAPRSFDTAREEFLELYPSYEPGKGVEAYLQNGWSRIISL